MGLRMAATAVLAALLSTCAGDDLARASADRLPVPPEAGPVQRLEPALAPPLVHATRPDRAPTAEGSGV